MFLLFFSTQLYFRATLDYIWHIDITQNNRTLFSIIFKKTLICHRFVRTWSPNFQVKHQKQILTQSKKSVNIEQQFPVESIKYFFQDIAEKICDL